MLEAALADHTLIVRKNTKYDERNVKRGRKERRLASKPAERRGNVARPRLVCIK